MLRERPEEDAQWEQSSTLERCGFGITKRQSHNWQTLAAHAILCRDHDNLEKHMKTIVESGQAQTLLEGLTRTKDQLEILRKAMDAALMRSFLVLERLGYSPDNPPPESPVN